MTDDIRTDPKPQHTELDLHRLPQLIGDAMLAADPDAADDIRRDLVLGDFGWLLDGWDDQGHAKVEVIAHRDGRVAGSLRVHWSQLVE
jgi:hypothetical protein